jgi:hypothetical protein
MAIFALAAMAAMAALSSMLAAGGRRPVPWP